MYIETSSPRQYGENAKLEFSVPSSDIGKLSCLKFYYHMYGGAINTLSVYSGNNNTFNQSGNQGDVWLKANITMILENKVSCILMITVKITMIIMIMSDRKPTFRCILRHYQGYIINDKKRFVKRLS